MVFAWFLLAATTYTGIARGEYVIWNVTDGGNGHAYGLIGNYNDPLQLQRWSWQDSKLMAEAMEYEGLWGHLVTITSAAESQFLIDTFHEKSPWPTWIGLTDSKEFGGFESFEQPHPQVDGWRWVTGEAVTFTNWYPGCLDEYRAGEDFVVMGSQWGDHHMWNDVQSGAGGHAPFFVEFEPSSLTVVPAPSSLACLVGVGVLVGLNEWRKKRRTANRT